MKNIIFCLILLLLRGAAYGQWKAQTAETYDKTYRIAYVTSSNGNATLRVLRNMTTSSGQKVTNPYDQIEGQILLNNKLDNGNVVQSLVFRFDDSPKIYIHQPSAFKQEWDTGSRKYIIESDWHAWRPGDTRDKEVKRNTPEQDSITQANSLYAKDIIAMLKAHKKVFCQIILANKVYGTQSSINLEFTLQNSTKSINYLFK